MLSLPSTMLAGRKAPPFVVKKKKLFHLHLVLKKKLYCSSLKVIKIHVNKIID